MKKRSIRSVSVLSRCLEPLEGRVLLAADHVAFITQPTDTAAGGTIDPSITVAVEDSTDKIVTGDTSSVTLSIDTGTGATGATLGGTLTIAAVNGLATFSDISLTAAGSGGTAYKLTAKDASLTSANSSAFNITPAAASQVVFGTQPSAVKAGAAISSAVTVDVEDKYGNIVTGDFSHVTLSVASGPSRTPPPAKPGSKISDTPIPATLAGTVTVPANAGVATFSDLELDTTGAYTLSAADGALTKATSSSFSVTAGTATQVVFGTGPAAAVAGATLAAITGQVEDKFGNVVTTDTSKITLAIASGPDGATLGGTKQVAAVAGIATFSDLALQTAGAYTISATDASLRVALSPSFTISPAAAAQLAIKQGPSAATAGAAISPAMTVMVEDQYGNLIATDSSKITAAVTTHPDSAAAMTGTAIVAASKGIATFTNLTLTTAGNYKITFTDASLTAGRSGSFAVSVSCRVQACLQRCPQRCRSRPATM